MRANGNMIFVSSDRAADESQRETWAEDAKVLVTVRDAFRDSTSGAAVTLNGGYNGNFYTGMRDSAFSGSVHQTRNVVIHELIHSGSVNGSGVGSLANVPREHIFYNADTGIETSRTMTSFNPMNTSAKDLTWMNYKDGRYTGTYDAIITACWPK